jgi:NTE family protein
MWLDPSTGEVMQFGLHATGFLRGEPLHAKARELFERFSPRVPFALTMVELPWLQCRTVRGGEISSLHLAATGAMPVAFPPVKIGGRRYVDGGLRGGLPLHVAEKLGATRALALNVLSTPGFRLLHRVMGGERPSAALEVVRLEPSRRLGPVRDAVRWRAGNIERWIALGEEDATGAASSITM